MSDAMRDELNDVLEAYMLDSDETGALARYLSHYPQYASELLALAHQAAQVLSDDTRAPDAATRASIEAAVAQLMRAWPSPAVSDNPFAAMEPADFRRVSKILEVPIQVIGAIRDGLAIPTSIPSGWLRRLAQTMGTSVADLMRSMGKTAQPAASFKSEARPEVKEPVPFERILIDAKVDPAKRAEIMSDVA